MTATKDATQGKSEVRPPPPDTKAAAEASTPLPPPSIAFIFLTSTDVGWLLREYVDFKAFSGFVAFTTFGAGGGMTSADTDALGLGRRGTKLPDTRFNEFPSPSASPELYAAEAMLFKDESRSSSVSPVFFNENELSNSSPE